MSAKRRNCMEKKLIEAVFRLGLVKKILLDHERGGSITQSLLEQAGINHVHPLKGIKKISSSTLFRYLKSYREEGIDGIVRKERSDKGKTRKLTEQVLEKAIMIRKDNPERTTETVLDILRKEYGITDVKRSTLDYHLNRKGYSRRMMNTYADKTHIRFESSSPNQLWIGDYHDKASLIHTSGNNMVHLSAFIDCYSRYIVFGAYYLKENLMTLEDSFKKAVLRHGPPKRVYVDNAKIYHSHRFAYACEKIGSKIIFSKAYIKESRGKIEKFFRYVKENFENEALCRGGFDSVDSLNEHFWAWLEMNYHRRVHKEIKCTPKERFSVSTIPEKIDIKPLHELFMLIDKRIVNKKTAEISVLGVFFVTENFLRGRKVQVHYNPNDLNYILVYYNDVFIHRAFKRKLNACPENRNNNKQENTAVYHDYLKAIKGEYETTLMKNIASIEVAALTDRADTYGYTELLKDFEHYLARKLNNNEKELLSCFYQSFEPFEQKTTRIALLNTIQTYGKGYHLSVYFDAIKLYHLNQRSKKK